MKRKKFNNTQTEQYEDEWGETREQRKRYNTVKAAIKKARKNKRRQRELNLKGEY